jgi:hypothetical protein
LPNIVYRANNVLVDVQLSIQYFNILKIYVKMFSLNNVYSNLLQKIGWPGSAGNAVKNPKWQPE